MTSQATDYAPTNSDSDQTFQYRTCCATLLKQIARNLNSMLNAIPLFLAVRRQPYKSSCPPMQKEGQNFKSILSLVIKTKVVQNVNTQQDVRNIFFAMSICQYVRMQLLSLGIKMKGFQNVIRTSDSHYVIMSLCQYVNMSICQQVYMSVCQYVSMSICQNATFQLRYQNESCSQCHQDVRQSENFSQKISTVS